MKKQYYLPLTLILIATLIVFQSSRPKTEKTKKVKSILKEYRSENGFIGFGVPAFVARPFLSSEPELKQIIKDIRMVRFLVYEDHNNDEIAFECANELSHALKSNKNYYELLTVKHSEGDVMIYAKSIKDIINELVILVNDDNDFVAIEVTGSIELDKILEYALNDNEHFSHNHKHKS
jgi:hypothetical protein